MIPRPNSAEIATVLSEHSLQSTEAREYPQFDGAVWIEAYVDNKHQMIITSEGVSVLGLAQVVDYLKLYERSAQADRKDRHRTFLNRGNNADVFNLDALPYVVKEAKRESNSLGSMKRMDRIADVVERHMPRWVDVPNYYAHLAPKGSPTHYTLIDKVGHQGLNANEILHPDDTSPERQQLLEGIDWGGRTHSELKSDIKGDIEQMTELLNQRFHQEKLSPSDYLADWAARNIIVEALTTPVAGKDLRYWIIDQ